MRTKRHLATLALLLSCWSLAQAADYKIDWSTIDGGGGQSTGSVYTVWSLALWELVQAQESGRTQRHSGFWALLVWGCP